MEDSLLALLPVILMVIFLMMYFCRYANTLEKCCSLKIMHCFRRRNANNRESCYRNPCSGLLCGRRDMTPDTSLGPSNVPADRDEALILLRGQITRMVLAESEAMRLAKVLFEDNEYAARDCIANLRSTLFPNLSVNSTHEYEIDAYSREQTPRRDNAAGNIEIPHKVLEQPPSYEDCV